MEQSNIQWIRENVDWLNNELHNIFGWDEDRMSDFPDGDQDSGFFDNSYSIIADMEEMPESAEWLKENAEWLKEDAERVLSGTKEMKLMAGKIIGDIIETSAKGNICEIKPIRIHWDRKVLDYWEEDLRNAIEWARVSHCMAEKAKSIVTSLEQVPESAEWLKETAEQLRDIVIIMRETLDDLTGTRLIMIRKICPQEVAEHLCVPGDIVEADSPDPTGLKELLDDLDSGKITPEEI